ncbi:MAG: X2-like carbohydrate binding domain-containing protein [Dehalococcoidia bacterium]
MKGKLTGVTQVAFALLLALSLNLVPALPVTATELPSISPTAADYDLDDPSAIIVTITWGVAKDVVAITDDDGYELQKGSGKDYVVEDRQLTILNGYLREKLTDIGDEIELIINFDVGGAILAITAIGSPPASRRLPTSTIWVTPTMLPRLSPGGLPQK